MSPHVAEFTRGVTERGGESQQPARVKRSKIDAGDAYIVDDYHPAMANLAEFVTNVEDSRRWRDIQTRPGDIVVSTPPKSGTTWMQEVVHSLLWPADNAPASRSELACWVDMRLRPIAEIVQDLDAQSHRRSFKTHSPADCVPFFPACLYIVVYRDGRDALLSWANHRRHMRSEVVEIMNAAAAEDGIEPIDLRFEGDYDRLYQEWRNICSPLRHLGSWWPRRSEPNVLFVHYADLTADLEGEMRRVAAFLSLDVEDAQWPRVVERCLLDTMRQRAVGLDRVFEGGAASFYHQGGGGRWRGVIPDAIIDDYIQRSNASLPPAACRWLEHGSSVLGIRPHEVP